MDDEQSEQISCPFECGFEATEGSKEYQIMLHMETAHSEDGPSPFVVQDDASIAAMIAQEDIPEDFDYVNCTIEGCGEAVLLAELETHVEMHEEEGENTGHNIEDEGEGDSRPSSKRRKVGHGFGTSFDTTQPPNSLRNLVAVDGESSQDHISARKAAFNKLFTMSGGSPRVQSKPIPSKSGRRRLGKSELGPHANEKHMPSWLVRLITEEDGALESVNRQDASGKVRKVKVCPNMMEGIIPVLDKLLRQDRYMNYAYLCDPAVRHVSKLKKEGGFCGYRNIQMLCSYIVSKKSQGFEHFEEGVPTIFDIQEYIEHAWDQGINESGRIETGGIRGTRKYIGTPDAQAMFCSIGISCDAQAFKPAKGSPKPAYEMLFDAVEKYFVDGFLDFESRVRCTARPPIYFQHPGHSMTIVGFEKHRDGTKNILVFDPMFHDSASFTKLIGQDFKHDSPGDLLKAYRRGTRYLKRYREFEILKLTPPKVVGLETRSSGK